MTDEVRRPHSSYRREGLARHLCLTTGPRQPEARALFLAAPLPFEKALLVRT